MATFTGSDNVDNINGTELADQIFGRGGADNLVGLEGNDVIEGGAGADGIFGSTGFDHASHRGSSEGVYASLTDLLGHYGDAEGDHLYGIEGLIGSAYRDLFTGGEEGDILYGEGGNDQLGGLDGSDKLYGGDGTDTASLYNYSSGVVADLAKGTATGNYTGTDTLIGIENLTGTPYADRLAGDGRANVLDGAFSADVLTGRGGADRFDYNQAFYSPLTSPDRISDFSRSQGDKIDVRDVDGNQGVDGVQHLTFIGTAAFTAVGQLHYHQSGGHTYIEANTSSATPGAEMVIILDQSLAMKGSDFLL